MNKKLTTERPELHPVPVKSPWHHLGMDFVGPISPPSQDGNRYILTVSDYFTKFAWAKAMATKEAMNVVSALREVSIYQLVLLGHQALMYHIASIFPALLYYGPAICHDNRSRQRVS